jgi:hypothetical protein
VDVSLESFILWRILTAFIGYPHLFTIYYSHIWMHITILRYADVVNSRIYVLFIYINIYIYRPIT